MGRGRPVAYWQGCLPFGLEWARMLPSRLRSRHIAHTAGPPN